MKSPSERKGILAWFASNHVAANLLMLLVVTAGLLSIFGAKMEVFPEFSLDMINVSVPYLGASPDDVEEGQAFTDHLNPESRVSIPGARIEPAVADDAPGTRYQFERTGYFASDPVTSEPGGLVFNRIVPLRDSWAKIAAKEKKGIR